MNNSSCQTGQQSRHILPPNTHSDHQAQPATISGNVPMVLDRMLVSALDSENYSDLFMPNMLEALVGMLMSLNANHYSKSLLGINLHSSIASTLPEYRIYQDRHFLFSENYCHWFIFDGFIYRQATGENQYFEDYTWQSLGGPFGIQCAYECRYRGVLYTLKTSNGLIQGTDFISLAGNISGLTINRAMKKICEDLCITSYGELLNFRKPQDCQQAVSPFFEPTSEQKRHNGLNRSGFEDRLVFVYKNPDGSTRGFVQLYSHAKYGPFFVPLTCWFHKDRPNQLHWVHLGFKKPVLLNLDVMAQFPEATIYLFDNEFLACNFENEIHRHGLQSQFIATTWAGGKHTLGQADFSLLRNRQVVRIEEKNDDSIGISEMLAPIIQAETPKFTMKTAEELCYELYR